MSTRPSAPVAFPLPSLPAGVTGAVVVGCSGGLDSSVLLHRLANEPALRARGLFDFPSESHHFSIPLFWFTKDLT